MVITLYESRGELVSREVKQIQSSTDTTIAKETYSAYDSLDRPEKITYLDGTTTETENGCCGLEGLGHVIQRRGHQTPKIVVFVGGDCAVSIR